MVGATQGPDSSDTGNLSWARSTFPLSCTKSLKWWHWYHTCREAHIISQCIQQLQAHAKGRTHYDSNTSKNYIEAIVRQLKQIENKKICFTIKYASWSWDSDNQHEILRVTLSPKVTEEQFSNRSKDKNTKTLRLTPCRTTHSSFWFIRQYSLLDSTNRPVMRITMSN